MSRCPNTGANALLFVVIIFAAIIRASNAGAVPSFAEQTGQRCSACHVGGLGPHLTPLGRQFKLEGYTMRAGSDFTLPLAAMAVASFVHTQKDQDPPTPHYDTNDNFALDQVSLFFAGGFGEHFGVFSQFTYDGIGRSFAWDQLDLRATTHATLMGSSILLGVDLNNSPGVQDVWNTLPAWGFPFTSSDLGPSPAAAPLISEAFAQRVLGSSIYMSWNRAIYAEAGLYWTPGRKFLSALGVDINDGDAVMKGTAAYARVAYQKDMGGQNFEIGAFGFFPEVYPEGIRDAGADTYRDLGIDASWQYTGADDGTISVNARYTHEAQDLAASLALDAAENRHETLEELHLDASYYWNRMVGFTVSPFHIWGSRDALFYADNRTMTPDSTGIVFQVDYTPWGTDVSPLGPRFNLRIGAQYTLYTQFNGAGKDYDGQGHNASDNNTFRLFTWVAF
jgi:hypothetical protein